LLNPTNYKATQAVTFEIGRSTSHRANGFASQTNNLSAFYLPADCGVYLIARLVFAPSLLMNRPSTKTAVHRIFSPFCQ